jgi:hypothetical protein
LPPPRRFPPTRQREALLKLIEALGCRDAALRRDECGDWRIKGRYGHIYAIPGTLDRPVVEGFQIYFRGAEEPLSSKGWTYAKRALAFCEVTNDGDNEGMLFLDRLPTGEEAEVIRAKLGVAKKREVSAEELARLAAIGRRFVARGDDVEREETAPKPASGAPAGLGHGKELIGRDP